MPLDLSLQSPSAFLEEKPRSFSPAIRGENNNIKKSRSVSPDSSKSSSMKKSVRIDPSGPEIRIITPEKDYRRSRSNDESDNDSKGSNGKTSLNVASWDWDNDYRHRTEKSEAKELSDKIKKDNSNLHVLDVLAKQLQESTSQQEVENGVSTSDGEIKSILKNSFSVDDCLKLKQLRREERLKRRAAERERRASSTDEQHDDHDNQEPAVPIPRKDLFTSEFHKEQEAKALELKKEKKLRKERLKQEKMLKAKKLEKFRATAEKMKSLSKPPHQQPQSSSPQVKPSSLPKLNHSPDTFKLPQQVISSKFPTPARDITFTISNVLPPPQSMLLDDFGSATAGQDSVVLHNILTTKSLSALPKVNSKPKQLKNASKSSSVAVNEYVDKQQMWALQVEAKKLKARKELEEKEKSELRVIPDVKKARQSWIKLKKVESKKIGQEWPVRKQDDDNDENYGQIHVEERFVPVVDKPSPVVEVESTADEESYDNNVENAVDKYNDNDDVNNMDSKEHAESLHVHETVVKDMITEDNIVNIMTIDNDNTIANVIEGEDGFEDDVYDDDMNRFNSTVMNSSIADMNKTASTSVYDETFFATTSVVKQGASLVLPDGEIIDGYAYQHPLQTNKNDSIYSPPTSPLKKVIGQDKDDDSHGLGYDTDRFPETERSTYDTPKGIFGKEAPPTSVRGAVTRWDHDNDQYDEIEVVGVIDTTRQESARSDYSDYENEWEFTGLDSNNNKTARGSEGKWRKKTMS